MSTPGLAEDNEPRPRTPLLPTPVLDRLGVEELQSYIVELRAEIARAETEIDRKQGHRAAAERFFRTP